MTLRPVAAVGASLAGLRAAEALRREGYEGRLVLVGDETHEPYDRPPLSKQVLAGEQEPDRIVLRPAGLDDLDLDLNEGPTSFDQRHNLVLSGTALVPHTGGLNFSWVARALSGRPFSLTNADIDPDRNG